MDADDGSGSEQEVAARKRALRIGMLRLRRGLPEPLRRQVARLVARVLVADRRVRSARYLAMHAATEDEVPTRPSFDALRPSWRHVLFPRVLGSGLEFAPIRAWAELEPGAYGVLAPPADRAAVPLGPDDVVLVPGVAFDERGGRLGRGGGYYDRTFEGPRRPFLVGVAFECQIVPLVPHHSHDRRMDAIVTERGLRLAIRPPAADGARNERTNGTRR